MKMKIKIKKPAQLSATCPTYKMNTRRLRAKGTVKDQRVAGSRRRGEASVWWENREGEAGEVGGGQQGGLQWVPEVVRAIESLGDPVVGLERWLSG